MITALIRGAIAGYGIAIPVGAIAILIVDAGMRRGFASARPQALERRAPTSSTRRSRP